MHSGWEFACTCERSLDNVCLKQFHVIFQHMRPRTQCVNNIAQQSLLTFASGWCYDYQ